MHPRKPKSTVDYTVPQHFWNWGCTQELELAPVDIHLLHIQLTIKKPSHTLTVNHLFSSKLRECPLVTCTGETMEHPLLAL